MTDISDATRRNWARLNTEESSRLTRRANKRRSQRKIVPLEYFSNRENRFKLLEILSVLDNSIFSITDVLCSVAENLFAAAGILHKNNVQKVLSKYQYRKIDSIINSELPRDEKDLPGLIYQSNLLEGTKNKLGSYYTHSQVTSAMLASLMYRKGQTFLDPCCGSGAFLLALPDADPQDLYGVDNDPTAVMIAEFNLLLRYPGHDFIPNIVCSDFLTQEPFAGRSFDFIVTNPPWGAFTGDCGNIREISSNETFSLFFVKSFKRIKENGFIKFLLPEAVLNVKVHKDIRRFILQNCRLDSITVYDSAFSGVVTGFIDIECQKSAPVQTVRINQNGTSFNTDIAVFRENENNVFCLLNSMENEIINQCRKCGRYTLSDSIWALGIVTGDNKGKLKSAPADGLEEIYTGKEIAPYNLKTAKNYILYDRSSFQQAAKDEYYRAPEKLVYKFISDKLVFAYDDKQRLFLNSANILIPQIPDMNIKTVLALLNSGLFSFLYQKMFGEVRILRGNLSQLPFPQISEAQDKHISQLVDNIISGRIADSGILQNEIFSLYKLTAEQIKYINNCI
ncbi:MAG: N-6 DNA methylase [Lentisphaeria bacterium]|nr:N-6 DNA methylase [Lentisphaeria bacterium]